jgi:hypothetical protein
VKDLVIGDILIGRHDTEDYTAGILHVAPDHVLGHLVDVLVLAWECNAGQTRQIDDGQVGTAIGDHLQDNGLIDDVFILAANLISQLFDGVLYL